MHMKPVIRKFSELDYESLCCLLSDPKVMLYLEPPYSKEQTGLFLQAALSECPPVYAVEVDGRFIGYVIYHSYDQNSVEIGWVLFPDYWGKGYASELTDQMINKARNAGKALVIECDPEQKATKHIAVKHGFTWSERSDGLDIYRLL